MKRIAAKIEEYQKDGETKGKYVDIGVIMENSNGEYIMLNPTIDLSGVLIKQRLLNPSKAGGSVICSVFDNSRGDSAGGTTGNRSAQPPADDSPEDFDSEIPF